MDASRPLLTRLRAENVRSFATLDLELGPLTVLVGPNGAGKSNVVALLRFLRDATVTGDVGHAIGEQGGSSFFLRRGEREMSVRAELVSAREAVELVGAQTSEDGEYVFDKIILGSKKQYDESSEGQTEAMWDRAEVQMHAMHWINRLFILQPDPLTLRDRSQRISSDDSLREDFSNLGAVLLAIRETTFGDEIDRALALLVDGVTGYTVLQAGSTLVPQILYGPDDARDLGLESDGTIRLVALLAAMYQPVPPSLIVLEEPEMGLHPGVLGALAEIIDEATLRMQVLVTTHSPDLIDRFDPDVVRIVEKVNGESVIGRVDPAQRDLIHKRLYRPSELMRIEGLVRERE